MKNYMMITGCEILDNDIMELTLIPLSTVKKKKVQLMDLVSGDIEGVQQLLKQDVQHKTKMYMPIETWRDMKLCIGRHVTMELLPDDTTGGTKL